MSKEPAYKKTEKWWLGLVVLFFILYNLPGVPHYGDPHATILCGALTIVPLWIIVYVGMIILNRQRKLTGKVENKDMLDDSGEEGA
jgi:hypothetical protein